MDSLGLGHYIATAIVLIVVGLMLQRLQARASVVYWVAHNFLFKLPNLDPATAERHPNFLLYTHAITIQNIGRKPAESVEIAHTARPDFFMLQPALNYKEPTDPAGNHIIRVPNLGPQEFFTIEFLSYKQLPTFLYIRSKDGTAYTIPIQAQRVFPKWLQVFFGGLMVAGAALLVFWLIRLVVILYELTSAS